MELAKLRYFYVAAKHQHITKAAEEIHIAQPALTKAIKLLEEELDAPLFYKKGRNIHLTPYGEYLKNKLENIFSLLDGIPEEIEHLKSETRKTVKINVLAASTIVTDAVVSYKKKNHDVIFQLIQNETETDCDVSVTLHTANSSTLPPFKTKQVLEEKIYLAVPKNSPFAQQTSIQLQDMKNEDFVHLAGSRLFRSVCDQFCAYAGFKPHTAFESDSPLAVKNIIAANAGVGFWPEFSWGKASSDVVLLPISQPICQRELIIGLHENHSASAYTTDFYEFLLKFLQSRRKRTPSPQ